MDVNEALARYQLAKLEFDRAELDLLQAIRGGQQAGWAYGTVTGRLPAPDGSVGSPALQQLKPEEGSVAARAADFLGPLRDVNAIRGAYARLSCKQADLGPGVYSEALGQLAAAALKLPEADQRKISSLELRGRMRFLASQQRGSEAQ
jgi:hypothetical protein